MPISASAMFSFTYAFIPWITATTATRNATLTMMPSSVKNERSLFARIWVIAVARTSPNRIPRVREAERKSPSNPHCGLVRAQAVLGVRARSGAVLRVVLGVGLSSANGSGANDCAFVGARAYRRDMPANNDPIPGLKREAGVLLAELLRHGNGDNLGALLGTDRFRIADLRRGRLERFSLETLLRFLVRAGMRIELNVTARHRDSRAHSAINRTTES